MTELCNRCDEPAEFHIETATSAECLCNHCRRVSWANILAKGEERELLPLE